jgi:DNA replication protein DnaC
MPCVHAPRRFEDRYWDSVDTTPGPAVTAALEACRRLADGDLRSVLLSGPVGCGKSLLAASTCNEIAERLASELEAAQTTFKEVGRAARDLTLSDPGEWERARRKVERAERRLDRDCARWITAPVLLGRMRREMNGSDRTAVAEVDEAIATPGLVVIDDLGAEKATEWTAATLFEVVSERYQDDRQILITSNLTARELAAAGYERITSRLADGGALVEMATGKDYRQRLRRSVA